MPGPAPTPTAMLTSWRAKKRAGEPQPPKTRPTCPTSLSRAAKKKFKEVVGWQESMGLETPVDRDVIVLFVTSPSGLSSAGIFSASMVTLTRRMTRTGI